MHNHLICRMQQIADQHHHAPRRQHIAHHAQCPRRIRLFTRGPQIVDLHQNTMALPISTTRWHMRNQLPMISGKTHSIPLTRSQHHQTRRQHLCIPKLAHFSRTIVHRRAAIQQNSRTQIALILKLLHVQPITPPVQPPIHKAQIIAPRIGTILGKLDRRPVVNTAMRSAL